MLVDGFDRFRGQFQRYPLIFLGDKEALFLEIWIKSALRLVVRVRNVVSNLRPLSRYLTNSRHMFSSLI